MRELLGGVIAAGHPAHLVAECLGVSADSIRTRIARDGWLSGPVIVDQLGIDEATLLSWHSDGLLPSERREPDATVSYSAVELVRCVAAQGD